MARYFAYGSNMSGPQMAQRCPGARFLCVAQPADHRLEFTRHSPKRACGVADIVAAEGESVWGVLYEVTDADLALLDGFEGANLRPPAYRRIAVQVTDQGGRAWDAVAYEVVDKSERPQAPNDAYLCLIREGAASWELPPAYRQLLEAIKVS